MRKIIDYTPELTIKNTEQLPRGLGCRLLLVLESPYPGEYVAKRWLHKMPATTARCEAIVRMEGAGQ